MGAMGWTDIRSLADLSSRGGRGLLGLAVGVLGGMCSSFQNRFGIHANEVFVKGIYWVSKWLLDGGLSFKSNA